MSRLEQLEYVKDEVRCILWFEAILWPRWGPEIDLGSKNKLKKLSQMNGKINSNNYILLPAVFHSSIFISHSSINSPCTFFALVRHLCTKAILFSFNSPRFEIDLSLDFITSSRLCLPHFRIKVLV